MRSIFCASTAFLLLSIYSRATIVPRLTLEQLVKSADKIVHGKVLRSWTEWDPAHEFIWTHYKLAVTDRLKGQASGAVIVSEPGGTLDGRTVAIQGTPKMSANQEWIVFLYRTPIGYWRDVGYGQGCYRVTPTGIQSDLSGVEFRDDRALEKGTALESLNRLSPAEFKRRVRAVIARQNRAEATR